MLQHKVADWLLFSTLRRRFGGRASCRWAEPVWPTINLFFNAGLNTGYGLTETNATVSARAR